VIKEVLCMLILYIIGYPRSDSKTVVFMMLYFPVVSQIHH